MLIDESVFKFLKNVIKKEGWLELSAFGNSMYPFIQQGNLCRFVPCEPAFLKKGDVVLYYSQTGHLIAHRIFEIKANDPPIFILKGDSNLGMDQPVKKEQILGKLVSVKKHHLYLKPEYFLANLWGKMILSFPILSCIIRKFLNLNLQL